MPGQVQIDSAQRYLEARILQHLLDGNRLACGQQLGLEDKAKGAIANNLHALTMTKRELAMRRHAIPSSRHSSARVEQDCVRLR